MTIPDETKDYVRKSDQNLRNLIAITNKETVDTIKSMKDIVDKMYYQSVDNFAEMKILKIEMHHLQEKHKENTIEHCNLQDRIQQLDISLKHYQNKMKPWEWQMEFKRIPFIFIMLTWVFLAWEYIKVFWIAITTKTMTGG